MSYLTRLENCFILNSTIKKYFFESKKHLMSSSTLGIDRFIQKKKLVNETFRNKEQFIMEMEEAAKSDNNALIFTNDIKSIIMVSSEANLYLIPKLLKKFSFQNKAIKFQRYIFGPDVMKLYYLYNKPVEALALVQDKAVAQYLIQVASFNVLADLLFNNGMYKEVVKVFTFFESITNVQKRSTQALYILLCAACYKLNTKSSLEETINLWEKWSSRNVKLHKRALAFIGMLALNQNEPLVTIEVLLKSRTDSLLLNIKGMALAKGKRFDQVLQYITHVTLTNDNLVLTADAADFIRNEFASDKVEYLPKFEQLLEDLKSRNLITKKTVNDFLFEEVDFPLYGSGAKEQL